MPAMPSGAGWYRSTEWRAGADTPRLLALWSTTSLLSGGAHGNVTYGSVWWDKKRGQPVDLAAMSSNQGASLAALRERFCPALNQLRAARRQGQTMDLPAFNACPDLGRQTLVPLTIGADRRIALFSIKVPPFEAGPHSEGTYEVTVPVTAAFIASLKEEWRDAFRAP